MIIRTSQNRLQYMRPVRSKRAKGTKRSHCSLTVNTIRVISPSSPLRPQFPMPLIDDVEDAICTIDPQRTEGGSSNE